MSYRNSTLKLLDVSACKIEKDGGLYFYKFVQYIPSLFSLDIHY